MTDPNAQKPADVNLLRVIAAIESSGSPTAIRFEPSVYKEYTAPLYGNQSPTVLHQISIIHACDIETAEVIASTSWGLYQIMGVNLYNLGYTYTVFEFVADPELQKTYVTAFLNKKGINYDFGTLIAIAAMRDVFAVTYNGSVAYGDRILLTAKRLGLA